VLNITTPHAFVEIRDPEDDPVVSQAVPDGNEFLIFFKSEIRAHSVAVFSVIEHSTQCEDCAYHSMSEDDEMELITDDYEVMLTEKGLIKYVKHKEDFFEFNQGFYKMSSGPHSGAYVFRPSNKGFPLHGITLESYTMYEGPVLVVAETRLARKGIEGQFYR
jgi:hypothetical protein